MIDPKLMKILACPKCKGDVYQQQDQLICKADGLAFPIRDDIPVMLLEEAIALDTNSTSQTEDQ